jgi:hypothetical protein
MTISGWRRLRGIVPADQRNSGVPNGSLFNPTASTTPGRLGSPFEEERPETEPEVPTDVDSD